MRYFTPHELQGMMKVEARDDAKAALAELYRRAATGERGLNFRNLEADTRASEVLAAAQIKMSRG